MLSRHNFMIDLANVQDEHGPQRTITAKRISNHDAEQRKELEEATERIAELEGVHGLLKKANQANLKLIERVKGLEKYATFGHKFYDLIRNKDYWFGDEWSEDVMPFAVEAGLAVQVKYDPEIHGQIEDAEPGYDVWIWTDALKEPTP